MPSLIRAGGLRGIADFLRDCGVAIEPLLDRVQIPRQALEDEELRVSLLACCDLLERVAVQLQCADLGLQIAQRQSIEILGPLAIAMQNAATVGEAMQVASRFLHIHSSGMRVTVHENVPQPGWSSLRFVLMTPSWLPRRHMLELCLADLHHFLVFLGQGMPAQQQVSLSHARGAPMARYVQAFGCAVEFEALHTQISVPTTFLHKSIHGSVDALHRISLDYLRLAYAGGAQTAREQVEEILRRALSSTRGKLDVVARLLGQHPRTLQRRLEQEGAVFTGLVDAARRDQALRWLTESDVPIAHVAEIIGLSDQAVLTRSCKRWFGQTPKQVRMQGG
ncbi:AraC family transcriptional regulator [Sinimarinibacterium sp. NLF-5-8]|uniref:AraC family transcriptional regulator n=1 Tax=Sinimarinibacterium sp. NLF-5-8 TaxID=2698684 RepID=UPI00137BE324|nr:AraC family transcriptional regulator [Sinimarinibacterium sp. NLF-5-8]QHS08815.1 helix-turn-helix domain-containing protein [Sinimarinibacterium sp. NLF-5-8]